MFYMYCVCVIIYANKDDDHHYYYYHGSKRHSLQAVELSRWIQTAVQIVPKPPALSNGCPIYRFGTGRPCEPAGRLVILLIKAGYVETNPGPTASHKRVWICDICYKQIHVRKQISIRCNMIEHWVHLTFAGIRQAQYTDTWTCVSTQRIQNHIPHRHKHHHHR